MRSQKLTVDPINSLKKDGFHDQILIKNENADWHEKLSLFRSYVPYIFEIIFHKKEIAL